MSKLLEIPDSAYEAIERAAKACGQTPTDFLVAVYSEKNHSESGAKKTSGKPRTLADRLRGKIGKFKSYDGGNWAEEASARFAEGMVEKHKAGHL